MIKRIASLAAVVALAGAAAPASSQASLPSGGKCYPVVRGSGTIMMCQFVWGKTVYTNVDIVP